MLRPEEGRPGRGWSENKAKESQARVKHTTEKRSGAKNASESTHPPLGTEDMVNETNIAYQSCQEPGKDHGKGKSICLGAMTNGILLISCKEFCNGSETQKAPTDGMQWETGMFQGEDNLFDFKVVPTNEGINGLEGQIEMECGQGPMALCYKENTGWIVEQLSPMSGHRKRRAREGRNENT